MKYKLTFINVGDQKRKFPTHNVKRIHGISGDQVMTILAHVFRCVYRQNNRHAIFQRCGYIRVSALQISCHREYGNQALMKSTTKTFNINSGFHYFIHVLVVQVMFYPEPNNNASKFIRKIYLRTKTTTTIHLPIFSYYFNFYTRNSSSQIIEYFAIKPH